LDIRADEHHHRTLGLTGEPRIGKAPSGEERIVGKEGRLDVCPFTDDLDEQLEALLAAGQPQFE
jgi:hypothetical protein